MQKRHNVTRVQIEPRSFDQGINVFMTTLVEWPRFNPHRGHVVASLDKMLYEDYLCFVALNEQQIQKTRIRRNPQEYWIAGNS